MWDLFAARMWRINGTRAILDIGSVHSGAQYQAVRIDQDMAFAAIDALGSIVAMNAANARRPYGLAVDKAGAGVGVASDPGAELLAEAAGAGPGAQLSI